MVTGDQYFYPNVSNFVQRAHNRTYCPVILNSLWHAAKIATNSMTIPSFPGFTTRGLVPHPTENSTRRVHASQEEAPHRKHTQLQHLKHPGILDKCPGFHFPLLLPETKVKFCDHSRHSWLTCRDIFSGDTQNHWLSLTITDYHWISLNITDYHWITDYLTVDVKDFCVTSTVVTDPFHFPHCSTGFGTGSSSIHWKILIRVQGKTPDKRLSHYW
jgi:hypothetical protein